MSSDNNDGGAMIRVDEFGADKEVKVRAEGGVWRELHVDYPHWEERRVENCRAVFEDARCAYVRKVELSHINVDIGRALARLANLEELTVEPSSINEDTGDFEPPPGAWPQLRRLDVDDDTADDIITDRTVLALAAAAPNLRVLSVMCTSGLHCLPTVLVELPALEKLCVRYVQLGSDGDALLDCRRLDAVTPRALHTVHLQQEPESSADCRCHCHSPAQDAVADPSTVELAAALGRMQQRAAPRRLDVQLCGRRL